MVECPRKGRTSLAPVVQWIELRTPNAVIQVRLLAGAHEVSENGNLIRLRLYTYYMFKNERITEQLVRTELARVGIAIDKGFLIEEQRSANPRIEKLLKTASKQGAGAGKPEFIVSKSGNSEFVLVIECKADHKFHASINLDQYKDYAVDGALLYASNLAKEFDVVAIGVSGQDSKDLKVSTYFYPRGSATASALFDENNAPIARFVEWQRYFDRATYDPIRAAARYADLMKFSRDLHNYLRDYAKITEAQKPLLVSGILLALMNEGYARAYPVYEGQELATKTYQAIQDEINKAQLGDTHEVKKKAVTNAFSFIEHHPELSRIDTKRNESPLAHVVQDLHTHVQPFLKDHYDFDIIGSFYGEFIRYTGGDGKGLGIVLTPKHITDLFADIAKLNVNSIVLDPCAGTGGFLISAMKKMTENATADEKKSILEQSLIGIEQEPQMFALAVSNMILRGDGKTNLYQGSCFDDKLFERVARKASVGFINPPYSQKGDNLHEWDFVIRMLDGLQHNGTGVAIVPVSLAITPHRLRERLLKNHRLEAVMSMPDDLFYPVGVVTCIMVFTAHVPHASDLYHESWFGYWKDDGFRKDKIRGRIPRNEASWQAKKEEWLKSFMNKKAIPGVSVCKKVSVNDEWCAEAYLETAYTDLSIDNFEREVRRYIAYLILTQPNHLNLINTQTSIQEKIIPSNWKWFTIGDLFELRKGKRLTKENMREGNTPFIGSTELNNGVTGYVDEAPIHSGNTITVTYNGSVAEAFYQKDSFWASDDVNVLYPNFKMNVYNALFICAIIRKEKYRYNYGRKWHLERMRESRIKLPITKNGMPDFDFMENYIKTLPYSSSIN